MKKEEKSKNNDLGFNEDYVWMSCRYCIGRHTIAAHYHATTIAQDVYGKISDERLQFNSEDICSCIYDNLHFKDFIDFGWYGNIPKRHFKPLDVVYSIFAKEGIDCYEKIKRIIPEFKPETFNVFQSYPYTPWWDTRDRESRIKAFNKLIEIYSK